MPIMKPEQAKRRAQVKASNSLHYENDTHKENDESGFEVENNMFVDTLIDPEDYDAAGSTHFPNEETSHPVLASKKGKTKVKASDLEEGCDEGGSPLNPDSNNVSTIDNLTDPDQGYIGAADMEDIDPDMDDDVDLGVDDPDSTEGMEDPDITFGPGDEDSSTEEASISGDDLTNAMKVSPLKASDDNAAALQSFDEDFQEDDEDDGMDDDSDLEADDNPEPVEAEDTHSMDEPEEVAGNEEDVSILDVDETPDNEVEDVAFATAGTRLLCIKANRIIASMTGRMAINSGRNDVYLTDQFQQVTAMQIEKRGLRAGLKSMGFALAKVNMAKQSLLKAQVAKQVQASVAASRKVVAEKEQAFEQSLAIAAVGINRRMFKAAENPLRAHLEGEFRRMGIANSLSQRVLATAFSEHGTAYAKQVIELAKKISAMPEQVRDGYVEALDLDSGEFDTQDEDMQPIGAEVVDDSDIEDEFGEPIGATSVHAALAQPGVPLRNQPRTKISAAASGKYSLALNSFLNGG